MKIKEKPITNEVRQLVHHIVDKWLDYNNTPTQQEYTGDKPTFFVDFSGHCGIISVCCYPYGYIKGGEVACCGGDINFSLCESEYITEDEISENLNRILSNMERYYKDWYTKTGGCAK